jgi:hypothetical protein
MVLWLRLTINSSSEASPENERTTSSEEVDVTPKLDYDNKAGKSDMYNSTRSSGHIDACESMPGPENTTPGMLTGFCQSL